jgi:hypothetical protein
MVCIRNNITSKKIITNELSCIRVAAPCHAVPGGRRQFLYPSYASPPDAARVLHKKAHAAQRRQ